MDIMASMIFTYSWLDFIDMPLFAMFVFTCTQTSNIRSLFHTLLCDTLIHGTRIWQISV